jgi:hypothetical protein
MTRGQSNVRTDPRKMRPDVHEDGSVSAQPDLNRPRPSTEPTRDDLTTAAFVAVLRRLKPHLPISDAYERDLPQRHGTWWSSQQEHMIGWFGAQDGYGSGKFTRTTPNTSARRTYNRLLSPPAFVWMAEALGEDPAVVLAAADAARAEPNARKRPALLRRLLPWERIVQLAKRAR